MPEKQTFGVNRSALENFDNSLTNVCVGDPF